MSGGGGAKRKSSPVLLNAPNALWKNRILLIHLQLLIPLSYIIFKVLSYHIIHHIPFLNVKKGI